MACVVPVGFRYRGRWKREYTSFKNTQRLPALGMTEAGETCEMAGCVGYSCQAVSMYLHFYISTSAYVWPIS